ncbi:MAG: HAMP domain-containing histidine kinase [Clostridia bacterium]|nr:HAMP domain-containing histidine kinase [Clostridia bacterium]
MNNKAERLRQLRLTLLFVLLIFGIQLLAVAVMFLLLHLLINGRLIQADSVNYVPLLYFSLSSVVIGTLLATLFGRRSLAPLWKIMDATDRIAEGDYSVRIDLKGPHEFRQLSTRFNHMAEELGSVELLRSDFINDFSHEFKTPIVSIRGFAKMLKRSDLSQEEREEYLDIIIQESERLASLSSNVLLMSKLEKQTILTDVEKLNAAEQLRRAVVLLSDRWEKKELSLALDGPELEVRGNRELLEQVWINLLDNAIKFSPQGGEISLRLESAGQTALISVTDQGKGMTDEVAARIFDKFYQQGPSRGGVGNGLGLSIAQRIVTLHQGSIHVKSAPGEGAVFTVELPLC